MNVELGVSERFYLGMVLPNESNFATLKIIRRIKDSLSFSEEEHVKFGIKEDEDTGQVHWSKEKEKKEGPTEIQFGKKVRSIIYDALEKMNNEKRLSQEYFTLYEKFVGDDDEETSEENEEEAA